MDKVDCIVIGAGVIGLAVARALALKGREVLVLEAHRAIGMETSSRNSEVIHAGLYYPTDSLKAKFCVAGRERLYAYCEERSIPHQRCGKLIVATSDKQQERLAAIHAQAHANGCCEVIALKASEAKKLEPNLSCVAALCHVQRIKSKNISLSISCFHAQQVAEKSLKAVLASKGIRFKRTHDLVELFSLNSSLD